MRKMLLLSSLTLFYLLASPQNATLHNERLKIIIDCGYTSCDMNFIRTEINIVDFMLDRQAADVYVQITEQETGGGGSQFQLIFFGQNKFKQITDTLRFNTAANATDFEERELYVKYLKLGLIPYLVRTGSAKDIQVEMKKREGENPDGGKAGSASVKDPWNYWVLSFGVNGHLDADAVYKTSRLSGNFNVNRVTEELKVGFGMNAGRNNDSYELEDTSGATEKIINKNDDYNLEHFLVKSINSHWSYGYQVDFSRSTFSNNKHRAMFTTGVEYNIFPYKQVNTKFFTLAYTLDVRRNAYFDTTLYDKTAETLFGHGFEAKLRINQKWGNISVGAEYHNYFLNWKYFNLEINGEVDIRLTGSLSFNIFTSAALIRDQLYLPKEGATQQEVLTRRRQLASGYRIFSFFGVTYRFGSKLNNFVNPRFD